MAEGVAGDAAFPFNWRDRLVLALDLDDLDAARRLAGLLRPYFSIVKVGLELFSSVGPRAIEQMVTDGFEVFVDLKLHDIPTTVRHAARAIGRTGARYLTVHTAGGEEMCLAAVEGFVAGAKDVGAPFVPIALGVTVLTSEKDVSEALLSSRARVASKAGCGGVVCAAPDLGVVRAAAPGLLCVVPGTRPEGLSTHDQARVATPARALADGASLLVIGRVVTAADDPLRGPR